MADINNRKTVWHKADEDEVGKSLLSTVDHIDTLSRARFERDRTHSKLYTPDVSGNGEDALSALKRDHPQFNMIKQGVDTMASQIVTNRYLPHYVITEGEFTFQRTARLRTRVLEGQIHDKNIPEMMSAAFYDAAIHGTGHLIGYLDPETKEPEVERALPGEIRVDPRGSISGKIYEVFRRRNVSKDALVEQFKDSATATETAIRNATGALGTDRSILFLPRDNTLDEAQVTEGWYWGPGKGRHVIALSSCVLVDEEWEWGNPTVPVRYQRRQVGYWGLGLAEIGRDSQARLDDVLTRITECQQIGTTVWMLLDERSKIRTEKLSNRPMTLVRHSGMGNLPVLQVFNATPPELFAEVDRIRERFLAESGISSLSAEAKKPAGLNSAPAQRAHEDQISKRHQPVADQYKLAWRGVIELLERLNDRAQKATDGGFSINARTQRGLVPLARTVKWSDVGLPPEKFRLTMLMTSDLPFTASGRQEAISEWTQSGLVTRPSVQKQAIDHYDDTFQRMELSDVDYACWQAEEILEGKDVSPEPYQSLTIAADVMRRGYLVVKSQGCPEEILAKMRAFVDACLPPAAPPQALPQMQASNVGLNPSQAADPMAPPPPPVA